MVLYEQMELSLLILVCIHKSYRPIVYLDIYVVPIGHGFSFFGRAKVMEINVEKEGAPCSYHRARIISSCITLFFHSAALKLICSVAFPQRDKGAMLPPEFLALQRPLLE